MEEIAAKLMEVHKIDDYMYYAPTWVPVNSETDVVPNEEDLKKSKIDQKFCVEKYSETKFYEESIAVAYLIQCMNLMGWRWHEDELIIMSH